jgi:hypothetical protein
MGQEMAYRYQESLIADLLHALRAYRDRIGRAAPGLDGSAGPLPASESQTAGKQK